MEKYETCVASENVKWCSHCGSSKNYTQLPHDTGIPKGIHAKTLKTGSQIDTCTPKFIAALFTSAKKFQK